MDDSLAFRLKHLHQRYLCRILLNWILIVSAYFTQSDPSSVWDFKYSSLAFLCFWKTNSCKKSQKGKKRTNGKLLKLFSQFCLNFKKNSNNNFVNNSPSTYSYYVLLVHIYGLIRIHHSSGKVIGTLTFIALHTMLYSNTWCIQWHCT